MIDLFGERPNLTFWMSDEDTIVTLELVEDDTMQSSNFDAGTKNKPKQKRKKHGSPANAKESADVVEVTQIDASTSTNGEHKKGTIAGVTGNPLWIMVIRLALSGWAIKQMIPYAKDFQSTSHRYGESNVSTSY